MPAPATLVDPAAQPLENARWEIVASAIASGSNQTEAYLSAFPDCDRESARCNVVRLITRESVSQRIQWLKGQTAEKAGLSRTAAMQFLADVVQSKVAQLPEDSPLIQKIKRDRETGVTTEISIPDKLKALELAGRMAGWLDKSSDGGLVNVSVVRVELHNERPERSANAIEINPEA